MPQKDLQYWEHLPQDPVVLESALRAHFGRNPPQSFESSKAISMRWSRRLQIKSTPIMPQEGPPVLGQLPLPRDPSSGGSGLCRAHFGPIPPIQSF
jgi:hypothetical protein